MTWFNSIWDSFVPTENAYQEEQRRLQEERKRQERMDKLKKAQEEEIQKEYFGKEVKSIKSSVPEGSNVMEAMKAIDENNANSDTMDMISGWARQAQKEYNDMQGSASLSDGANAEKKADEAKKEGKEDVSKSKENTNEKSKKKKKKQKAANKKANEKKGGDKKADDNKGAGDAKMGSIGAQQEIGLETLSQVQYDPSNPNASKIQSKMQIEKAQQQRAKMAKSKSTEKAKQASDKNSKAGQLFEQSTKIKKKAADISQKADLGIKVTDMALKRIKAQKAMLKAQETKAEVQIKKGKITQVKGKATQVKGQAVQSEGIVTQAIGKCIQLAGKALAMVGQILISVGQALMSTPFTASAGAALVSMGTSLKAKGEGVMEPEGQMTETEGKATEKSGEGIEKGGQKVEQAGKKVEKSGQMQKKQAQMRKKRLELQEKQLQRAKEGFEKLKKAADKIKQIAKKIQLAALAMQGKASALVALAAESAQEALQASNAAAGANSDATGLAGEGKELLKTMKLETNVSDDGEVSFGASGDVGGKKLGLQMGENGKIGGSYSDGDTSVNFSKDKNGWGVGGGMGYDSDGDGTTDGTFGMNAGSHGFGMNASQIDDDGTVRSFGMDSSGNVSGGYQNANGDALNVGVGPNGASLQGQNVDRDENGNITHVDKFGANTNGDFNYAGQDREYNTYTDKNGNDYQVLSNVSETGFSNSDDGFGIVNSESQFNKAGQLEHSSTIGANTNGNFNLSETNNQYDMYQDESGRYHGVMRESDTTGLSNANGVLGFSNDHATYNERGQELNKTHLDVNSEGDGSFASRDSEYYNNGVLKHREQTGISKQGDTLGFQNDTLDQNKFGQVTDTSHSALDTSGNFDLANTHSDYYQEKVYDPKTGQYVTRSVLAHQEANRISGQDGEYGFENAERDYNKRGQLEHESMTGANTSGDFMTQTTDHEYDNRGVLRHSETNALGIQDGNAGVYSSETDRNQHGQVTDRQSSMMNTNGDFNFTNDHNEYQTVQGADGRYHSVLESSEGSTLSRADGVLGIEGYDKQYNKDGNLLTEDRAGIKSNGDAYAYNKTNSYWDNGNLKDTDESALMRQDGVVTLVNNTTNRDKDGDVTDSQSLVADSTGYINVTGVHNEYDYEIDPVTGMPKKKTLRHSQEENLKLANGELSLANDEQFYDKSGNLISSTETGLSSLGNMVHKEDVYKYDEDGNLSQADSTDLSYLDGKLEANNDHTTFTADGKVKDATSHGFNSDGDFHANEVHNEYKEQTVIGPDGKPHTRSVLVDSQGTKLGSENGVLGYDSFDKDYDANGRMIKSDKVGIDSKLNAHASEDEYQYDRNGTLRHADHNGINIAEGKQLNYDESHASWDKEGDLTNKENLGFGTNGTAYANSESNQYETYIDENGQKRKVLRSHEAGGVDYANGVAKFGAEEQTYNRDGRLEKAGEIGFDSKGQNVHLSGLENEYDENGVKRHTDSFNLDKRGDTTSYGTAEIDYNEKEKVTDANRLGFDNHGNIAADTLHNDYQADGRTLSHSENGSLRRSADGNIAANMGTSDYDQRGLLTDESKAGFDTRGKGSIYGADRHIERYNNGSVMSDETNAAGIRNGNLYGATETSYRDANGQLMYHDKAYADSNGKIDLEQQSRDANGSTSEYTLDKAAGQSLNDAKYTDRQVVRDANGNVQSYHLEDGNIRGDHRTVDGDSKGNLEVEALSHTGETQYKRSREVDGNNVKDITLAKGGQFKIDNYDLQDPSKTHQMGQSYLNSQFNGGKAGDAYGSALVPDNTNRLSIESGPNGEYIFDSYLDTSAKARIAPDAGRMAAGYSQNPEMWTRNDGQIGLGSYNNQANFMNQPLDSNKGVDTSGMTLFSSYINQPDTSSKLAKAGSDLSGKASEHLNRGGDAVGDGADRVGSKAFDGIRQGQNYVLPGLNSTLLNANGKANDWLLGATDQGLDATSDGADYARDGIEASRVHDGVNYAGSAMTDGGNYVSDKYNQGVDHVRGKTPNAAASDQTEDFFAFLKKKEDEDKRS